MSAAKSAADQAAAPDKPKPSCVRTILSVDDSQTNRYVRARVLRAAGFEVIEAETGCDALRLAAEKQPCLVLLDVRLPDMNGFEVCRRLKSDPGTASIPVINISALGRYDDDLPLALKHEADTFLREPVEPATLVATVEAVIRVRAEQRQRELEQREKAEKTLRDSEAQFRTLANAIPQLCWIANADGWIFWYNQRWYEYTGTTPEQMEGWGWQSVHDPEKLAKVLERWKASIATGHSFEMVFPLRGADGVLRPFLTRIEPVRDQDGNVVRWFGTNTDITERLESEERLRASEERYRTLFTNMSEGFGLGELIYDADGRPVDARFLDLNQGFETQTGLTRDIIGHPIREVLPNLEPIWLETYHRVVTTSQPEHVEDYNADTRRHYSVYCYSPMPGRFAIIFRDISERKRAEEALQEREREFRELAESMPQFVWVTDANGMALFLNHRWQEQLGVSVEEMLGEGWARVLHPDDRDRVLNLWYRCASSGEHYETEYRFRTVTGEYRRFLARGVPIRDEQGRIRRWFGTCTDIEDTKRAEERLRQSQKLESVGLLAGGIAHDFNNLLTGMMGNASLVVDHVDPDSARRINEVIRSAERAAHLTRQLLAYAGKGEFVVQDLDFSQMINAMGDLMQFSLPKSVNLAMHLERRLPQVKMDPSQFEQIVLNLVINAGEAIGDGNPGNVAVTTATTEINEPLVDAVGQEISAGRYVTIEVTDTGVGIGADKLSKVFDPFFTTKFTGRGLGLAAVAGIVRSQHGGITVRSTPGEGSTFCVLFRPAGAGAEERVPEPVANARGTIMVADDESSVREFIGAVLQRDGYRVLEAVDGREALAIFDREKGEIDGVVLDVVMPVMGANELLPELKARRPDLGILLTSGYTESEAKRLCAAYPGAAFIQKPYTANQISTVVRDVLGASKAKNATNPG